MQHTSIDYSRRFGMEWLSPELQIAFADLRLLKGDDAKLKMEQIAGIRRLQ